MTELEMLKLEKAGIPVHQHNSPKRGIWFCKSPYCLSTLDESPRWGPLEQPEHAAAYDLGDLEDA